MLKSFGVPCGGDFGGVVIAREIPVAVGEGDRRALTVGVDTDIGLITSEWSRIGQAARHSTPVSRGAGVTSGRNQRCRRGGSS